MQLSNILGSKIKSIDQAAELAADAKVKKQKVVLTTGCFDILHSGHLQVFRTAKEMGDLLIVGLNSDESIRKIKGLNRPILKQKERMLNVVSLLHVDYAVVFREDTPIELIKKVRPDFFIKGGDWSGKSLPESATVENVGGRVIFAPIKIDISTSKIIQDYDQFREE